MFSNRSLPFAVLLLLTAAGAQNADSIAWEKTLAGAMERGKKENKLILVCVNAKYVDGRKTEERANKGLREVIYRNERVVAKSREFVCKLINPGSSKDDYAELRVLGIAGEFVSPQHIFIHPNGKSIVHRRLYWSFGSGDRGIDAMIAMMEKAQELLAKVGADDGEASPAPGAAPTGEKRAAWIAEQIRIVVEGKRAAKVASVDALIKNDTNGDCLRPLTALIEEHKKSSDILVPVIRGLGRDELFAGAIPISTVLTHSDPDVRGNAAVSLEYIGGREKKVIDALRKAVGREKDERIANHMYRALGRCGVLDSKVRALLLKKCNNAKSEVASLGPAIGLAYYEGDAKAARGVEKILKKIGIPGGRRGGGGNIVKRGVVSWALASIGDKKSGKFVRKQLLERLENVQAFWVNGLKRFYRRVAEACEGDKSEVAVLQGEIGGFIGFALRANPDLDVVQKDEYRRNREFGGFTPRGEGMLGQ